MDETGTMLTEQDIELLSSLAHEAANEGINEVSVALNKFIKSKTKNPNTVEIWDVIAGLGMAGKHLTDTKGALYGFIVEAADRLTIYAEREDKQYRG